MRPNQIQSGANVSRRPYFFLPDAKLGCHAAVFWLGAAAIVLIFCFLGFFASRLPLCSPFAMLASLVRSTQTLLSRVRLDNLARRCAAWNQIAMP